MSDEIGFTGAPELYSTRCGPEKHPLLLLLHGVTRNGRDWEPLLPALAQQWQVITLDQRGHGRSDRSSSYRVLDYVADSIRFVREEIAAPLVILGHSLGAMVGAAVAAQLPELVYGLILEDPPFHSMGARLAGSSWEAIFEGMLKSAKQGKSIEELSTNLAEISIPLAGGGSRRLGEIRDRAALLWSAQCLIQLDPAVLAQLIDGRWLEGYHFPHFLSRIRCPTLLLQADPTTGGALTDFDAAAVLSGLASGQLIQFPGVGHQIHREQTELMLQTLQNFAATHLPYHP